MGRPIIEVTNGTFYNTRHPTAVPIRVIRVGDIFEVDSIGVDGCAKFKANYGGFTRDISLDGKYWRLAAHEEYETCEKDNEVCVSCKCDIMVLMSVGCKCGWLAEENRLKEITKEREGAK